MQENTQPNNDKQDDASNKSCYCKKFFDTSNLGTKILINIVAIIIALYVYNKTMAWYGCSQIEKISKELILVDNDFGWLTLRNRPVYVDDLDSVNSKMLLLQIIKQQNEILKNQKNISSIPASCDRCSVVSESKSAANQASNTSGTTTTPINNPNVVDKMIQKNNADMSSQKNNDSQPKTILHQ